ncbi:MAG: DUF4922 domain-containing protein, partial [Thermodesulfobacteriota bacterium]
GANYQGEEDIIKQKIYSTFDGKGSPKPLPELCLGLQSEQKKTWQDLQEGYELLKEVRERDIFCNGFSVRLQYNPGRMKSSTADVREKDVKERQCFLCLEHLPEGQKGILHRSEYLVLCNPMPVFSSHLTVSHIDHRGQSISENIGTLLQLMEDFGSGWTLLYNGPRCGASAPDHLHFQAVPSGKMPIEKEIEETRRLTFARQVEGVPLVLLRDVGREIVMLQSDDRSKVGAVLERFLSALKKILLIAEEPMINIAGSYSEKKWRLIIFPRRKHRPDIFFKEGDARVVVSPGVIDMGGVLITPVVKDFERLNATAVENIYREVTLESKLVEKAIDTTLM